MNKKLFILLLIIVFLGGFFVLSLFLPGNKIIVTNKATSKLQSKNNRFQKQLL